MVSLRAFGEYKESRKLRLDKVRWDWEKSPNSKKQKGGIITEGLQRTRGAARLSCHMLPSISLLDTVTLSTLGTNLATGVANTSFVMSAALLHYYLSTVRNAHQFLFTRLRK